ncbi:MAG: hypothetical protein EBS07_06950 [Sphingobacteriia bacterium]|nr:hypothetical protein [Sphingobacteriia bacterium]
MFLGWQDFWLTPLWAIILVAMAMYIAKAYYPKDSYLQKWFLMALTFRMIFGIIIGLLYNYYYGYGDTLRYYFAGKVIADQIFTDPITAWHLLWDSQQELPADLKEAALLVPFWKLRGSALFLGRFSTLINLLTFHSYYAGTLLFSAFSFSGMWVLFRAFVKRAPQYEKELALSFLFLPSVLCWSSGWYKEPIAMGALGWMWAGFLQLSSNRKGLLFYGFIVLLFAGLLIKVKAYLFLVTLPFMAIIFIWEVTQILPNRKKAVIRLIGFTAGIFLVTGLLILVTKAYPQFAVEFLLESIVANREELLYTHAYYRQQEGSRFDIGDFDPTWEGVLAKFPLALFAGLFRPAFFDFGAWITIPSILESSFLLFLTLITFYLGIRNRIKLKTIPIVFTGFLFSIIFCALIGLSTSNFGTLVRYRMPALPFYTAFLLITFRQLYPTKKGNTVLSDSSS